MSKKDSQLWTNLVGKETGLGWDPTNQTIDASDEWWEKKLKENPKAAKFRTKGLKYIEQLNILFKDVAATGEGAWAPSSGYVPNDAYVSSRESLVDTDLDDNVFEVFTVNQEIENINNEIGSSTSTLGNSTKGKGKKRKKYNTRTEATERLCKHLDRICDAVESRISLSFIKRDQPDYSIAEVLNILRSINEIEKGGELFMLATKLFLKRENREMLVELKDVDLQIEWLNRDQPDYSIAEVVNILQSINEIERKGELFMLATKLFLKKENRKMFVELKNVDLQIEWLKKMK